MNQKSAATPLPRHPAPATQEKEPKPVLADKRTIKLEYPVTFAGECFDSLTVRRLKAKDFRQLDVIEGGGNAAAIAMAALICGVEEGVIDELDAVDYVKVQEAIANFFPRALVDKLPSGASPSSQT